MLKIVYPICRGMDVHKSFLVACVAFTDEPLSGQYTLSVTAISPGDCKGEANLFCQNKKSADFIIDVHSAVG